MEDSLYEVECMRLLAGITIDTISDETTILNFQNLLETHHFGEKLFVKVNRYLEKESLSF